MQQEQLDRLRHWFDEFVARFYGTDEYVNAHLQLKQEHTRRTCMEIVHLAQELALDDSQGRVAELIALFHDIGRFPQFARYRTYNDYKSTDHCRLGVETLRQEGVLSILPTEERQWVETAVEHHGRKCLPPGLKGQTLLFAKLIRDADKLDIFRIVVEKYRLYQADPEGFPFEIEFPDTPECSAQVVDAVLNERLVDYTWLRTVNDFRLCQLGWVYDMNFAASLVVLRQRGFLEALLDSLPAIAETEHVRTKILRYTDTRIEKGG
jgi:putative nucleotidyltransferase with HDIG domain